MAEHSVAQSGVAQSGVAQSGVADLRCEHCRGCTIGQACVEVHLQATRCITKMLAATPEMLTAIFKLKMFRRVLPQPRWQHR